MVVGLIDDAADIATDVGATATDATVDIGERALDVPADAFNASTGTGENLGWFGTIDRALDPRGISEEEAAEPTAETTGLSGFFAGGRGALTQAGSDVGAVTADPILAGLGFGTGGQQGQQEQQQSDGDQSGEGPAVSGSSLALLGVAVLIALYLIVGGGS